MISPGVYPGPSL